jgi:hypothetical protein
MANGSMRLSPKRRSWLTAAPITITRIEYVLRFDYGLTDVSALLDSQPMHRDLNRRCADAREKLEALSV